MNDMDQLPDDLSELRRLLQSVGVEVDESWLDATNDIHHVTSPYQMVVREIKIRQFVHADPKIETLPIDAFIFGVGEPERRDTTKFGGLPYRPADRPWPIGNSGQPMTFIGQLRFTESTDLVGQLPSDILLIFAEDEVGAPESFHFEWQPLSLTHLVQPPQVPAPGWEFVTCFGVPYRTIDLRKDSADPQLADSEDFFWGAHLFGTKIGGLPFWIQDDETPVGKFLGSVGPIQAKPDVLYPWINQKEPLPLGLRKPGMSYSDPHYCLMWGDMGNLHLFMKEDGSLVPIVQSF